MSKICSKIDACFKVTIICDKDLPDNVCATQIKKVCQRCRSKEPVLVSLD
jgi:hypothetical protein